MGIFDRPRPSSLTGWVLLGTGLLTCPCHLPLTLGLLTAVVAGTAWGAFIAENVVLVGLAITAYSVIALLLGWRMLRQPEGRRWMGMFERFRKGPADQPPELSPGPGERMVTFKDLRMR